MIIYGYYLHYSVGYDGGEHALPESVIDNCQLFMSEAERNAAYNEDIKFCAENNLSVIDDYLFSKEIKSL